jgi:hypothetical protein
VGEEGVYSFVDVLGCNMSRTTTNECVYQVNEGVL